MGENNTESMEYEGRTFRPAISYAIVRKIEAGMSDGGIDLSAARGVNEAKWYLVCASRCWVTQSGALIEHNMKPGDRIFPRPPRKVGETQLGKPVYDAPGCVQFVGMPKDCYILAIPDIMMSGTDSEQPPSA